MRVVALTTHPVQYQVPYLRRLSSHPGIDLHTLYGMLPDAAQQGVGFGVPFQWDIPLMDGYAWTVLPNRAPRPSVSTFGGIHAPGVLRALRRLRPHAAIVFGWQSLFLVEGLAACCAIRIPALARAESNALRSRAAWKARVHRRLAARFSGALAIGSSNREFWIRAGMPASRIHWAPYSVDGERIRAEFLRLSESRAAVRASWGIRDGETCILFAGKLQEKKRIFHLLAALAALGSSRVGLRILVAGAGEQWASAQAFVRDHALPVVFAGFLNQTEIARAYAAADCLALPSDYGETWGLVVNEAMACGLPCLVSDRVGCGPDLVTHDVTGLVVPFGDLPAWGRAMLRMHGDPETRRRLGVAARERVAAYSLDVAIEGTVEALRRLRGAA